MKVTLLQENLKNSLIQLQKAIPSKPQLPILASILLNVGETEIVLSATDLYLGIRSRIQGEIKEVGQIAVPGEIFRQLIASLPAGKIDLFTTEKSLVIKTASTRTQIPYQTGEEFPQFPDIGGLQAEITSIELEELSSQVGFAISSDATRPVLTAMAFNFFKGSLEVAGTDGFRLSVLSLPPRQNIQDMRVLLPAKTFQEVNRIAQQNKTKSVIFQVDQDLKQVKFILDTTEIFVRMIEGDYPPYEKIIPTSFATKILLDPQTLLLELKRAVFFAKETSNIVRLTLSQGKISILARSPSYGEYQSDVEVNGTVPNSFEVAFNATYVIDFLLAQEDDEIVIEANESLKPVMFSSTKRVGQKYIVMPFRVSDMPS